LDVWTDLVEGLVSIDMVCVDGWITRGWVQLIECDGLGKKWACVVSLVQGPFVACWSTYDRCSTYITRSVGCGFELHYFMLMLSIASRL
jgi:hypothetical protein